MAINLLTITAEGKVRGLAQDGTTAATIGRTFGGASIPALSISLSYGTGSGQASWFYYASRTVTATTADNLDLYGSLTDGLGNTINAATLKLAVIAISSPDGTKALRVGPRSVANAMLAGFGDASDYKTVTHWDVIYQPVSGYAVTSGTADLFCIYNPGGSSVTYSILMAGT